VSDFEGLCDGDHFSFYKLSDHWEGSYTRRSPKGKIVVAWNHVSPSQIESYQKCPRSWYFKSILKIPEAQKGHQSLGEAFHLVMEKVPAGHPWPDRSDVSASSEDWDKADQMAKLALPLMPVETKPFKREHGIGLETYEGGPRMVGYIDLAIPYGVGWPAFIIPPNEAIVADYKTLSDFRYMRTPEELANSVQMMTYAKWAITPGGLHGENDPLPSHIRLLHLYAKSRPPFTKNSIRHESAIVSPGEIDLKWNKTLDTVREMQQVATCTTNPEDVEAKGALNGHCEAYGGCHFRDKCGISKQSSIKTLFQITKKPEVKTQEPDQMGSPILDKIRAAQAAAQSKAASAGPSNNTAPVTTAATSPTVEAGASGNTPAPGIQSPALTQDASPATTVEPSTAGTVNVTNPSTAKGPISGLLAKIQKGGHGRPTLGGAIAQSYGKETGQPLVTLLGEGKLQSTTISTMGELLKLATGVVPPDAPPRAQDVITRPGDQVVDPIKIMEPTGDDVGGEEDGEDSSAGVADTATSAPVTTGDQASPVGGADAGSSGKRGRPSKAEVAAREAAQRKAFEDAVAAEVAKRVGGSRETIVVGENAEELNRLKTELAQAKLEAESERKIAEQRKEDNRKLYAELQTKGHSPSQSEGLTLYVDCFPTKGDREVTDFFEWIGPICRMVADANAVGDWRQINYTAKGLLANAIRETVKEHGTPKAMTISSYAGGSDIALEVLTPLAKRVIKKL
jgi:hypothetical protein